MSDSNNLNVAVLVQEVDRLKAEVVRLKEELRIYKHMSTTFGTGQMQAEVERLKEKILRMRDVICHIAMTDPTGYCAVFGKACGLCAYARNVLGPKYRMPGDELKETKT